MWKKKVLKVFVGFQKYSAPQGALTWLQSQSPGVFSFLYYNSSVQLGEIFIFGHSAAVAHQDLLLEINAKNIKKFKYLTSPPERKCTSCSPNMTVQVL